MQRILTKETFYSNLKIDEMISNLGGIYGGELDVLNWTMATIGVGTMLAIREEA